ncbi:hypothetical protein C1646_753097 [Rhizophagus diaphanus]|nr:hypothetical protein C1646_753097 [Rhizophagus diaphanus] [Rhizophagus sp. MUCL 43196]
MSSQDDEDDASKFLANFRSPCLKAIITNLQEIKKSHLETYSSNESFKHKFTKKISGVTSINELNRVGINIMYVYLCIRTRDILKSIIVNKGLINPINRTTNNFIR